MRSGYYTFINAITVGMVAMLTASDIVGAFTFALGCVTVALIAKGFMELVE